MLAACVATTRFTAPAWISTLCIPGYITWISERGVTKEHNNMAMTMVAIYVCFKVFPREYLVLAHDQMLWTKYERMCILRPLSFKFWRKNIFYTSLSLGATSLAIHQAKWHKNSVSPVSLSRPIYVVPFALFWPSWPHSQIDISSYYLFKETHLILFSTNWVLRILNWKVKKKQKKSYLGCVVSPLKYIFS